MEFPKELVEKQISKILEKKGVLDESVPAPGYNPRSKFHDRVEILRSRLFPTFSILGSAFVNYGFYSIAPSYYKIDNAFNIGALTLAGAIIGVVAAEGLSYYIADRESN